MSLKVKSICLKFSSIFICLLLFQYSFSQKKVKEIGIDRFTEFDAMVQQNQKLYGGNIVAMIWTDTLVYKRELGDFTAATVAPIASCSKWLTAALVMQFVDAGKISLDDKVSKYIPLFATYNKNFITIRHCLSHMTGIQGEPIKLLKLLSPPKKYNSLEEEVNDLAKKEIQSNPGTEFFYSNIGLDIAGRVLEIISKKKFDMLIRSSLFVPLGMRQTTFTNLDGSAIDPSGGAFSTATDYMHFLQMLLNNGMYNGKRVLNEESVKQLRQTQTTTDLIKYTPKAAQSFNYALGSWVIEENNAHQATVLACPGLFGTWPMIDFCRGYACLFFVKTLLGEQKADTYMQMKIAIDDKLASRCK
jgi:CubicO group peptidase (beta-lactamase class C family)